MMWLRSLSHSGVVGRVGAMLLLLIWLSSKKEGKGILYHVSLWCHDIFCYIMHIWQLWIVTKLAGTWSWTGTYTCTCNCMYCTVWVWCMHLDPYTHFLLHLLVSLVIRLPSHGRLLGCCWSTIIPLTCPPLMTASRPLRQRCVCVCVCVCVCYCLVMPSSQYVV